MIKWTKQIHQSEHNHGLMNQENHGEVVGKIVGGSIPMIRWIKQPETGALDGT